MNEYKSINQGEVWKAYYEVNGKWKWFCHEDKNTAISMLAAVVNPKEPVKFYLYKVEQHDITPINDE